MTLGQLITLKEVREEGRLAFSPRPVIFLNPRNLRVRSWLKFRSLRFFSPKSMIPYEWRISNLVMDEGMYRRKP